MKLKIVSYILLVASIPMLNAATFNVNPGTDRVQSVVANANSGDTIIMKAGTHIITTPIFIEKNNITLKGEGWTRTFLWKQNARNNSFKPAIRIRNSGNNCLVRDFEIIGGDRDGPGIWCYGENNRFRQVLIHHVGSSTGTGPGAHGFRFNDANDNSIQNCTAVDNLRIGFAQNNARRNEFLDCIGNANGTEGLTADCGSHSSTIKRGIFNNNKGGVGGIGIDDVNDVTFNDNTVDGHRNSSGVTIQGNCGISNRVTVNNNTIKNMPKHAVYMNNCSASRAANNMKIRNNTFQNISQRTVEWCNRSTHGFQSRNVGNNTNL